MVLAGSEVLAEEEVDDARVRLLRSSNLALGSGFRLGLNCG